MPLSPPLDRMDIATLRHYLDDADAAQEFSSAWGWSISVVPMPPWSTWPRRA